MAKGVMELRGEMKEKIDAERTKFKQKVESIEQAYAVKIEAAKNAKEAAKK